MSGTESEPETKRHRKPVTGRKMDPHLTRNLMLPTWLKYFYGPVNVMPISTFKCPLWLSLF